MKMRESGAQAADQGKENIAQTTTGSSRKADFSDLVGRWTPEPTFDEIMASQRQVDWEQCN
jgi:hypothetical protein